MYYVFYCRGDVVVLAVGRQERAAEGATRAVVARRGPRWLWRRWAENVTRARNEQQMAQRERPGWGEGGCSNDSGGNVVARMVGGRRCDEIRWQGSGQCNKRVKMMASDMIGRQMMQRKRAADDRSGAENDQTYLRECVITVDTIHFCPVYLQIEPFIMIGIFECYVECPTM